MQPTPLSIITRSGIITPHPLVIFLIIILSAFCIYLIHIDFCRFKALGPGGTPSTFPGYVKIKFLSLFAISNPLEPAAIPPSLNPQSGYLKYISPRIGPRPAVEGIAPHRQTTQRPPIHLFNLWSQMVYDLAQKHPQQLRLGTSCLEKHGPGLFTLSPSPSVIRRTGSRNCSGEICHSHPSDGSTHLTLHPADAAIVLNAGWGERHPLAKGGWLSRFVPGGFLMVYAPRTAEELLVKKEIVKAAIWWVGGYDVESGESRF
ncbi:hypothetical protein NA57DRAFT_60100 [Rhizodiscina lignyota]|uniref:Luciferase domain-containing protein n=1 Tax=Rhizodiscina lignyota TaxID=1504668 RepID=A0A9P4I8K3_9PEZI|nr:hypothetical protein NA57DRAFT_60100 [Rhizodiscina lignyota]